MAVESVQSPKSIDSPNIVERSAELVENLAEIATKVYESFDQVLDVFKMVAKEALVQKKSDEGFSIKPNSLFFDGIGIGSLKTEPYFDSSAQYQSGFLKGDIPYGIGHGSLTYVVPKTGDGLWGHIHAEMDFAAIGSPFELSSRSTEIDGRIARTDGNVDMWVFGNYKSTEICVNGECEQDNIGFIGIGGSIGW